MSTKVLKACEEIETGVHAGYHLDLFYVDELTQIERKVVGQFARLSDQYTARLFNRADSTTGMFQCTTERVDERFTHISAAFRHMKISSKPPIMEGIVLIVIPSFSGQLFRGRRFAEALDAAFHAVRKYQPVNTEGLPPEDAQLLLKACEQIVKYGARPTGVIWKNVSGSTIGGITYRKHLSTPRVE